ncbi:response regulator [Ramlibacter sp.]|uniref:response regulator n=1 Tax=Ramlibacter sp. TaxID=1917967 RepID=UPI0017E1098F|nr:response regulator [Ramlibacter sp.]MBA2672736.1 response regulator transcription factor [Ramlibacter sp.]
MPIRVFLVEDSRHMHGLMEDLLSALGDFQMVATAPTEAEAKLWLEEHPGGWDLAVLDLILEQGSGMGVIPRCKAQGGGKVVVFSDYATPGVSRHCLKLGADAVFQKSGEMQAFIAWCAALGGAAAANP